MLYTRKTTQTNKNKIVVIIKTGFYSGDFYTFNVCWLWDVSAWLLVKTLFFCADGVLVSYCSCTNCHIYRIISWKPGLWDGFTGPRWCVCRAVYRGGTFLQLPGLRAPRHSRPWLYCGYPELSPITQEFSSISRLIQVSSAKPLNLRSSHTHNF